MGPATQPTHLPVNHPPVQLITGSASSITCSHVSLRSYRFSQELPGFLGPEFALRKLTGSYRLSMHSALFVIHVQEESWRLGHKGSHGRTIRPCAKAKGKPQKADLAFYVSLSCEECLRHPPCCYHWPRGPLGLVKQPAGVT